MNTGAHFWLLIPKEKGILENSFCQDIGFPFTFDEIVSITIKRRFEQGPYAIDNEFDDICALLTEFDGFDIDVRHDRLEISVQSSGEKNQTQGASER